MAKVRVSPDIIQVHPDGRIVEINLTTTKKPIEEHNLQSTLYKQAVQTCPFCKEVGRIWGGRCLACGEWYD